MRNITFKFLPVTDIPVVFGDLRHHNLLFYNLLHLAIQNSIENTVITLKSGTKQCSDNHLIATYELLFNSETLTRAALA